MEGASQALVVGASVMTPEVQPVIMPLLTILCICYLFRLRRVVRYLVLNAAILYQAYVNERRRVKQEERRRRRERRARRRHERHHCADPDHDHEDDPDGGMTNPQSDWVLLDDWGDVIDFPAMEPQSSNDRPPPTHDNSDVSVELLGDTLEVLDIPVLQPEPANSHPNKGTEVPSNTVAPSNPIPWDGKIHWVVDNSLPFSDRTAVRPLTAPGRYEPGPGVKDAYRSVIIENLPVSATMDDILPLLGGETDSAFLLDTVPITGSPSALVIFLQQSDAETFVRIFSDGLPLGPARAKVVPVSTPTTPLSTHHQDLVDKRGYTRTVRISSTHPHLGEMVRRYLGREYDSLVETTAEVIGAEEIHIRFRSIKATVLAYRELRLHPQLWECEFEFLKHWQLRTVPAASTSSDLA